MKKNGRFNRLRKIIEPKTKARFKECIFKLHRSNQLLRRENNSVRAFKHDFNNILQVLGGYIQAENYEQLKIYYQKMMKETNENKISEYFRKMINQNPAIFKLISNKYELATEKNINMNIEIMCNLREIKNDIYEVTRILGILLDNAIEAANECEEKKEVYVQVIKNSNLNQNIIIIENTYINKNINLRDIYKKNFTTKEKNSGLGLWKVQKIVSKTKSLKLNTFKGENYFRQSLTVQN